MTDLEVLGKIRSLHQEANEREAEGVRLMGEGTRLSNRAAFLRRVANDLSAELVREDKEAIAQLLGFDGQQEYWVQGKSLGSTTKIEKRQPEMVE